MADRDFCFVTYHFRTEILLVGRTGPMSHTSFTNPGKRVHLSGLIIVTNYGMVVVILMIQAL